MSVNAFVCVYSLHYHNFTTANAFQSADALISTLTHDSLQLSVALKVTDWRSTYPMDYYASDSLGPWTVNNEANKLQRQRRGKININPSPCDHGEDQHCCKNSHGDFKIAEGSLVVK